MTKEWNGEGVPPVGIDIVFIQDKGRSSERNIIVRVEAVTHDNQIVFCLNSDCDHYKMNYANCFKPIKSKQDIEREAEEDKLQNLMMNDENLPAWHSDSAEAVIRAGYRNNGEEVGDNTLIYDHIAKIKMGMSNVSVDGAEIVGRYLLDNFKIYPRGE